MRPYEGVCLECGTEGPPTCKACAAREPAFTYAVRLVALVVCSIVYGAFFVLLLWAIASVMLRSVA